MKKVKLGEMSTLIMGQSPSSESYNSSGIGLPFYQGTADFGKVSPSPKVWCSEPKKVAEAGDVLISVRAPIGAVNIAAERCCIGRGVAAIRPREDALRCVFAKHMLSACKTSLEAAGTGSTFKAVGRNALSELVIPYYSINDQLVIEGRLEAILRNLEVGDDQISKLDGLVKSRFFEMFGDPDDNPKGFETKNGSDLFKIGNGKTKPRAQRLDDGIPAYGGNGISWYTNETLVEFPTIVIGRVGRHCGNVRLVKNPCWVTDNAMFIKECKSDDFDLLFLNWLITIIDFNRFADKGDLWKITQKPFSQYDFYIPPLALQREFAVFAQQVEKLKSITQQQTAKLQLLYDCLAQEYFGEGSG